MASTTTLAPRRARLDGARRLLQTNPGLPPALLATVIFVALAGSEAGFYPIGSQQHPGLGWYPAALLLLAVLGAAVIAVRPRGVPRGTVVALALLGGYTVWSFLSITWAEAQGVAWDGANRTAIYLLAFALFALWPTTRDGATILVGALGLGLAGLGLVEVLKANAAAVPTNYFVDARFAEPAGYINANVGLWTMGLFACLYLATARHVNPALRGLSLGGAGILSCLALLGQSRGWVFAVPIAALLFVAFTPRRARALAALAVVVGATLVVKGTLLAVHDDFRPGAFDGLLADATRDILLVAAVLSFVGGLAAVADRQVSLSEARSRVVNRAAAIGLAAVIALGVATVLVVADDPFGSVSDSWNTFKKGGEATLAGDSRFTSVGTNRYDFWSVAWDRFRDRPLVGIGSENFQQDYLASGNSGEQPRYPHSLVLGVLSQTGLIGALLLAGALIAAAVAAARRWREADPGTAAVAGAAATIFAYWLIHASVDWFWEFPGLTAPAFAMLGLACAVGLRRPFDGWPKFRGRPVPALLPTVASAAAATILAVSYVLPWISEREIEKAATQWPRSPATAFDRLDRAAALNPLAPKPHLVAAAIAVQMEDQDRAVRELREVLELEPRTPFALAEMAALASERGQNGAAERLLERASGYAPNDIVVRGALEQLRSGGSIDVRDLNASYLKIARSRVGRD